MGYDLVHRLGPPHRLGPNLQRQLDRSLRCVVRRVGRGVADLLPRPLDVLQQLIDLTLSSLLWVRRQHSRMINSPSDLDRQPRQLPPPEQVFSVSACINQHFGFRVLEHRYADTSRKSDSALCWIAFSIGCDENTPRGAATHRGFDAELCEAPRSESHPR